MAVSSERNTLEPWRHPRRSSGGEAYCWTSRSWTAFHEATKYVRSWAGRRPAPTGVLSTTPIYGMVQGSLTSLVHDLWSVDPPIDPALTAVLEPVRDAAMKFTPFKPLLPQWDQYTVAVRAARQALESQQFGQPTVDEIIHEMLLSLKTSVLLSGTAVIGSWTVIATEIARRYVSFAAPITLPLRFYDVASKEMVDHPSPTTLSLAAIKAIIDPVRDDEPSCHSRLV